MISILRVLFFLILASMLVVTIWAGSQQSLGAFARSPTFREPWVVATLLDAYWGFISFYVWVAWKEQGTLARGLWFIAIILLGNVAMAVYMLRQLFAVSATSPLAPVFVTRNPGHVALPAVLSVIGLSVYFAL